MENRQVVVRCTVNKTVVLKLADYGINRKWRGLGSVQQVPFDALKNALWDHGTRYFFDTGMLYIDNMQDKIDLELEPAGAKEPENIIVLNEGQKISMLKVDSLDTFREKLEKLSKNQVDALIDYAIDNEVIEMDKCNLLKEMTGKDIIRIITSKEKN